MPAPQPMPAVLARAPDADAHIVCLPPPAARLPRPQGAPDPQFRDSRVLAFPARVGHPACSAAPGLAASVHTAPRFSAPRFSAGDRLALLEWQNHGASGYARLLIEDGQPGSLPDCAAYALIYRRGTSWASWGLTRRGGGSPGIMAWRCSTGATLGVYATMEEALLALPSAGRDAGS